MGGVVRRATIIKAERTTAEHMLLLDAGNSLLLDEDPARRTQGATSIEVMNRLGYDAAALGMVDFASLDLAVLEQRIDEAQFPFISANAKRISDNQLVADPYVILEMADHRVGILGISEAGTTDQVAISEPLPAVREWLPEVRRQADIVILLSHAGVDLDQVIAQQVPGIDVIVSGRTRTIAEPLIVGRSSTMIIHAESSSPGAAGEKIGVGHLTFDAKGTLIEHQWERITLESSLTDDLEMTRWMEGILSGE